MINHPQNVFLALFWCICNYMSTVNVHYSKWLEFPLDDLTLATGC